MKSERNPVFVDYNNTIVFAIPTNVSETHFLRVLNFSHEREPLRHQSGPSLQFSSPIPRTFTNGCLIANS